jgi:hypothetical protein
MFAIVTKENYTVKLEGGYNLSVPAGTRLKTDDPKIQKAVELIIHRGHDLKPLLKFRAVTINSKEKLNFIFKELLVWIKTFKGQVNQRHGTSAQEKKDYENITTAGDLSEAALLFIGLRLKSAQKEGQGSLLRDPKDGEMIASFDAFNRLMAVAMTGRPSPKKNIAFVLQAIVSNPFGRAGAGASIIHHLVTRAKSETPQSGIIAQVSNSVLGFYAACSFNALPSYDSESLKGQVLRARSYHKVLEKYAHLAEVTTEEKLGIFDGEDVFLDNYDKEIEAISSNVQKLIKMDKKIKETREMLKETSLIAKEIRDKYPGVRLEDLPDSEKIFLQLLQSAHAKLGRGPAALE